MCEQCSPVPGGPAKVDCDCACLTLPTWRCRKCGHTVWDDRKVPPERFYDEE